MVHKQIKTTLCFLTLTLMGLSTSSCGRRIDDTAVVQAKTRAMQTRSYAHTDTKQVLKSVVAVLQDEGFMIKTANSEIGLLTAERDTSIEKFSSKFWAYVFSGKNARWKKHSTVEITTNVTDEKGMTKLRVNFLVRVYDNLGRVLDVHTLSAQEAYQDFFNKVQKNVIQNQ